MISITAGLKALILTPILWAARTNPHTENDFTPSITATGWWGEDHCRKCGANIGFSEFMSDACHTCGHLRGGCLDLGKRSARLIWNGRLFRIQRRYHGNALDIKWGEK